MLDLKVTAWLKAGKYLPAAFRDFHDQKELFKAIDETIQTPADAVVKRPNWVEAQCYVIDVFLWYMARRGYTLQRTRTKLNFRDLDSDVAGSSARRDAASAEVLASMFRADPDENSIASGGPVPQSPPLLES